MDWYVAHTRSLLGSACEVRAYILYWLRATWINMFFLCEFWFDSLVCWSWFIHRIHELEGFGRMFSVACWCFLIFYRYSIPLGFTLCPCLFPWSSGWLRIWQCSSACSNYKGWVRSSHQRACAVGGAWTCWYFWSCFFPRFLCPPKKQGGSWRKKSG